MIKSSCQLKMKAVFLSLLFLSVVFCNPFHLKDEQGRNWGIFVWYCFGCTMKLIHINTHGIFKSLTKRLKTKSDGTLTSLNKECLKDVEVQPEGSFVLIYIVTITPMRNDKSVCLFAPFSPTWCFQLICQQMSEYLVIFLLEHCFAECLAREREQVLVK